MRHKNIEMLEVVCRYLEPILDRFVLLGGCATALLVTDKTVPDVRVTLDVDLIVDVLSKSEYYDLEQSLRDIGFVQRMGGDSIICRWEIDSVCVDVMPTKTSILGFSNRWYPSACEHSESFVLSNGKTVSHVTAPYFLATKIEAFLGRGNNDFMMSHDVEDIVTVIDGRAELINEIMRCEPMLQQFIADTFKAWLSEERFVSVLPGLLPPDPASQARLAELVGRLEGIARIDFYK